MKITKIANSIKARFEDILIGKNIRMKIINSKRYKEYQTIEEQIQELKNEEKKLRSKIRHESDEHKREKIEQQLSEIRNKIKKLQEELSKCKEKMSSDDIQVTFGPVLIPLYTAKDTHSVIANLATIDKSQIESRNVSQSSNMKDSHDKQSK